MTNDIKVGDTVIIKRNTPMHMFKKGTIVKVIRIRSIGSDYTEYVCKNNTLEQNLVRDEFRKPRKPV